MNKNLKSFLAVLLVLTFIIPLASCGTTSTTSTTESKVTASKEGGTSTPSESTGAAATEIDTSSPASITMLVLGNKPTNGRMEEAVAAENVIIKEKINAELKLQYIEWADWQTNYQLALASGDSTVDLIVTATDWLFAWQSVRRGAFLPLSEEMLSTYAPKTWAEVTSENWEACTSDDNIWFIPEDQFTQWTNHGMFYRGDWATEAGIDKISNFQGLEDYFKYVLENKEGVIPWDVSAPNNQAGLMTGYLQSNTTENVILGTETGYFGVFNYDNSDPYTVTSPTMDSEVMVDFAKLMKSWADQGFWREDVLNYQGETRDLMYAGLSGADQHHTETYVHTIWPNMEEKQPGSDAKFFYWGQDNGNYNSDLITHGAMAISASSKNPERALMLYDLLRNDEEVYTLHNYGIEEVDYLNKDGILGRPEGWDATNDSLDTNFWAGRMDAYTLKPEREYNKTDELYAELAGKANNYPLIKFAFVPDAVSSQIAGMADVCATYIPTIAFGKMEDPVATVAEFREALLGAGYEDVKAEVQRQLDELKIQEG